MMRNSRQPQNLKRPEIEIEEIFLDRNVKEKTKDKEIAQRKLEVPLKRANFLLLFAFGLAVFGALMFGALKLQLGSHREYEALAKRNKFIVSYLASERGIIYDRNKKQLIKNEASFDLWLSPSEIPEEKKEEVLRELSLIFKEDINITTSSDVFKGTSLLKKNLNHRELILLETKKEELPGFKVQKRILRHYEKEGALSHILGYLGKISSEEFKGLEDYNIEDYIGREGLEKTYEDVLRERKGEIQIERTAEGKEISRNVVGYPKSGNSLVLSLDFDLQKKIENELNKVFQEVGSNKGAGVALDPRTGDILASVSLPFFDNNLFAKGISPKEFKKLNEDPNNPQLNRVIGGLYPSGSTIKPLIATAALSEKVITPETTLFGPLELCIEHQYTKEGECFPDWTFHGWTDVRRAIAESINPFFYLIGGGYQAPKPSSQFFNPDLPRKFEGLGAERLGKYLRLFGLGEKTGIDLPGEVDGRVPDPAWKESYFKTAQAQKWYLGDSYNLSIGQGYLLTTPLQMARSISAIINGGNLFKPKIVKGIIDSETNAERVVSAEVSRENFISQDTLKVVKEGMRQTVSSPAGSAFSLSGLPVPCGAKTGTAQVFSGKDIYHNWIAVFCPYETPEIVLTVLIEEVQGTRVAAQKVAKEVLQWYFTR